MALIISMSLFNSCYKDEGNYTYVDVNEAIIGEKGFEKEYVVRKNMDFLKINPSIDFTLDPEQKGDYSYEWVAVGQNFHRGKRFVISKERNLNYKVNLNAESYILYYKIKDNETDLVYSKSVSLVVNDVNSTGWILGGVNEKGEGQVDMISFSNDVLILHSALQFKDGLKLGEVDKLWIDNDPWASENRLYVTTSDGTWKFDRKNFEASPYSSIKYSFPVAPDNAAEVGKYVATDHQKIADKREIIIVDGRAYPVSTEAGIFNSSFSTYNTLDFFETAPEIVCNHKQKDVRTFIFYDIESKAFVYISGLKIREMKKMGDGEDDAYSWITTNDFPNGLDFVHAVNSFFANGQSAIIMKEDRNDYWIYLTTANNYTRMTKDGRYRVTEVAKDFDKAVGYIMTTNHGYLLYAVDNVLYGYNFRSKNQECVKLMEFDSPITAIHADNESPEKGKDIFYVATFGTPKGNMNKAGLNEDFSDSRGGGGSLYKLNMVDSPNEMAVRELQKWEKSFLKINSIIYKAF